MLRQFILGCECGSVNPLQLLVVGVSTVIGTGNLQKFESLDFLGVIDVRACAKIQKLSVLIKGYLLLIRDIVQPP